MLSRWTTTIAHMPMLVVLFLGCGSTNAAGSSQQRAPETGSASRLDTSLTFIALSADSIRLERFGCGIPLPCTGYEVLISKGGEITFLSRNPVDSGRIIRGSMPSGAFKTLMVHVLEAAFVFLPPRIESDSGFCRFKQTEGSTFTITLYTPRRVKRVQDYEGCKWAPASLRALEDYIDKVAGTQKWIRRLE
jgi:hypothetical protein